MADWWCGRWIDERIALTDQKIKRLTKLNASRIELIAQTEAKLEERKAALAKSQEALQKEEGKKARLLAAKEKHAKAAKPKLSAEERSAPERGTGESMGSEEGGEGEV